MAKKRAGPLTLGKLAARLANIEQQQKQVIQSLIEFQKTVLAVSETGVRRWASEETNRVIDERSAFLQKLHDDAVNILRVLVEDGLVDQERLNGAVTDG
jgi:hypothetical protein